MTKRSRSPSQTGTQSKKLKVVPTRPVMNTGSSNANGSSKSQSTTSSGAGKGKTKENVQPSTSHEAQADVGNILQTLRSQYAPQASSRNDMEELEFLSDVLPGKRKGTTEDPQPEADEGVATATEGLAHASEHENDDEEEDDDSVVIEEVETSQDSKTHQSHSSKIRASDFDNPRLAIFAKRTTRMATCLVNLCPEDSTFMWSMFKEELAKLIAERRGVGYLSSLRKIESNPETLDEFRKFMVLFTSKTQMSYGICAIRLDIGKEVHIRTSQFFNIPGQMTPPEVISSVTWLLEGRRYHNYDVNLEARTVHRPQLPFRSNLMAMILRGYFVEGNPKQDQRLVAKLNADKRIPLPLIAMIAVLVCHPLPFMYEVFAENVNIKIGHVIKEWAAGYKTEIPFAAGVLSSHYTAVMGTLTEMETDSPKYTKRLQEYLYREMITMGKTVIPSEKYDYNALERFAEEESQSSHS
ncbi:hypothetical protein C8R42DRAFT_638949 [Lentinula raphanica]|nr:hypothetical protein C8R42DRAFT_638949 [Lentinula raphanica]